MMTQKGVHLTVRQQPQRAQLVAESNPKNRKPIDPPPIVELKYEEDREDKTNGQWLVSPRTFMVCSLVEEKADEPVVGKYLIGTTVSSLHRLKDTNNKEAGFFVWGDISAKRLGSFKLRFTLFDSNGHDEVNFMGSIDSDPFPVVPQRDFGSMSESTHLTRIFSDQGVKLRVRKDNRAVSNIGTKRPYNTSPVSSSPHRHSLYGGPVQDHHYNSTTPEVKRQRADSDYGHPSLYSGLSMAETAFPTYGHTIPSSTRQWTTDDHQTRNPSFSQGSPLNLPMMNRMQSMNLSTASWQNLPQQGTLPSPSPSVSNQTPTYPSVSTQTQSSSSFGDTGSNSSIPRGYYSGYQYPSQSQYETTNSGETPHPYHDLQMPGTTLAGATGLGSTHTHAYAHGYLPTNALFEADAGESSGQYAYMDAAQGKF